MTMPNISLPFQINGRKITTIIFSKFNSQNRHITGHNLNSISKDPFISLRQLIIPSPKLFGIQGNRRFGKSMV